MIIIKRFWTCLVIAAAATAVRADNWPTFRHDNHRSGKTAERIFAEALRRQWVWRSPGQPQPAWAGPAKWDAYAQLRGLRSMRNFDPVFHVIAAGGAVYFGSSADDSVHCLDAATGRPKWSYTTGGPVRIAPTYAEGKLYFGSDDGRAYCLRADDGRVVWKHCPVPVERRASDRRILNNGRLIPLWPCRSGVLVDQGAGKGGTAYYAAGMLPWKESYLCAVDARTGRPQGPGRYVRVLSGVTLEGALLASKGRLFSPQGRVPPLLFNRADGRPLGSLDAKAGGGCFALITDDDHVLHGPGNKTGWITDSNAVTRERIATIGGGNEMVVAGDTAYLLTDHQLTALARSSKKTNWSRPCEYPYALILSGEVLFVGGRDAVAAFAARDGSLLWNGKVAGKAYGLAVADGRLLVSTDEGVIYGFCPGPKPTAPRDHTPSHSAETPKKPLEPIPPVEDKGLVGRWVFQGDLVKQTTVKDLAGSLDGTIAGRVVLQRVDDFQALVADGTSNHVLLAEDHRSADLPEREITAEAWVRVDRPLTWGGIIGAIQDNGDYERGWILGYNDRRFSFALCGNQGPGRLTYLKTDADFQPGQWAHLVGTYDGAQMKVYLNGKLAGASSAQKGPINYPPRAFYEIGTYHDQDEFFRLRGMIHEVRVYRRVLTAEEISKHYDAKRLSSPLPPKEAESISLAAIIGAGPYLQFTGPDSAVVRWETGQPSPTILEYGPRSSKNTAGENINDDFERIEDPTPKISHQVTLLGLRKDTVYDYLVKAKIDGKEMSTEKFECDTFFNYSPAAIDKQSNPYPRDQATRRSAAAAKKILASSKVDRGICLVLGSGDGRLVYELARQSRLRVIGVETSAERVVASRRALRRGGVYGTRVAIHKVDSLTKLPFPENFANLVVSERVARSADAGAGRPVQGGQRRWVCSVRAPLKNTGVWSHQYGLPDNSGYGGESLQGAASADDLAVQWIGRPGPRAQADRNGRKPSPLSAGGRLFMQGLHRMIAIDAYNGTILWSLETRQFERFNVPRDCGNWCADRQHVFAAIKNKCWRIDAADGRVSRFYDVVPGPNTQWDYDWGYLARVGESLIGSAVKSDTSFTEFFGGADAGWYDSKSGEVTYKICSDCLFSLQKNSGKVQWTYQGGLIVNPTITIGEGRVYFVECRNAKAIDSDSRRLGTAEFWQDQFLVGLNVETGRKIWEVPLEVARGLVVLYLAYSDEKLVLVSSDQKYHAYAFDATSGSRLWDVHFDWPGDNHGKHMSRPAIVGGKVFVRPRVIDLAGGKLLKASMPGGGCGTYALTDRTVIFRDGNVTLWDFQGNRKSSFPRLRPGCWLSTIPAGGMLLSPEAGGGCSCGKWLETSIGFIPRAAEQ